MSICAPPPQLLLASHSTSLTPSVSVSPLVVFEILDHFKHRNAEKNQRVLGTLLGTVSSSTGNIQILDSFAVPHSEINNDISIDLEYAERQFQLKKKTITPHSAKLEMVGWYSTLDTSAPLNDRSSLIHAAYRSKINNNNKVEPVLLTIDTGSINTELKMKIKAYTENTIYQPTATHQSKINAQECILSVFTQIPLSFETHQEETLGLEQLMVKPCLSQQSEHPSQPLSQVIQLASEHGALLNSVNSLVAALSAAEAFAQSQAKLNQPLNPKQLEIAFQINSLINSIPVMSAESIKAQVNKQIEDLMMVLYCSEILETQLALTDKVGQLIQ